MQTTIKSLLTQAIQTCGFAELPAPLPLQVEHTKNPQQGDYASNIALLLAKPLGLAPRKIAEQILAHIPPHASIEKIEIAGPGFLNFYCVALATTNVIKEIFQKKETFGHNTLGAGKRILIEFVSSNPTGPLHVGHGRGAAYGATVADILEVSGFSVHREYYINDAGRQMDILATSIWLRYLQACGESFTFPTNAYRGDYLQSITEKLVQQFGKKLMRPIAEIFANVPADEPAGGDKEAHIDGLIVNAKHLLGDDFDTILQHGLTEILTDIRADLAEFGVTFQTWFSERQLIKEETINQALALLQQGGHLYTQAGALWFRSTHFGDDKDRVVRRENGQTTYFAADIAYHFNKVQRGYDHIIDVLGADHHGYVTRIQAALQALGYPKEILSALLVQFAILYRHKERVQMSTRSGSFVTLRELREEVGNDAARFFYIMRKANQHLDFDLDLAKAQSQDNPLYYIQYAHARVCSVFKQLVQKNLTYDPQEGLNQLHHLTTPHELALLKVLSQYPEILEQAALHYEPHRVAHYLRDLAQALHSYYNAEVFLVEDAALRNARLSLVKATGQVLANGLHVLGVSAPEQM